VSLHLDLDGVATGEGTVDRHDAGRQQRGPIMPQRVGSPSVHHDATGGRKRVEHPVLAGREGALDAAKQRARHLSAPEGVEVVAVGSVHEHGVDAAVGRLLRRFHLRLHTAGRHGPVRRPHHVVDLVGDGLHLRQPLRVRVVVGIGGVEAVHVGADDEQVRLGQDGHVGGEVVVVAHLQLFSGDRVVLVHNRQRVLVEQLGDRVLGIDEAGAPLQVVVRQEHLRAGHVEEAAPVGHEQRLAEGGEGLPLGDREAGARSASPLLGEPGGHGAGGHEDHFLPLPTTLDNEPRDGQEVRGAAAPIVRRYERTAYLDDGTGPIGKRGCGHGGNDK